MFHAFSVGLLLLTLAMIGWIVFTLVHAWTVEAGSFWQRTLKAGRDSATIVWTKVVLVVGGLVAVLDKIATLAGDPSLATQIQQYATPQTVSYVMIAIMFVNVWARLRTLGK
ncbi:MAG TPA: hypothetical protein VKT76_17225 [Bradyrhizobium sp.]|nr:hypothetical protein [Bradyrhizobium sp.]